jgi:hypothetical protein
MKSTIFWDTTQYSPSKFNRETLPCGYHIQAKLGISANWSTVQVYGSPVTSGYGLEASSYSMFYRLGSHLLRVESHHNVVLSLSLAHGSSHPYSAARNYGANLTPFVLLKVAAPSSRLYYTPISTTGSSAEDHPLPPKFNGNCDCFCPDRFNTHLLQFR